ILGSVPEHLRIILVTLLGAGMALSQAPSGAKPVSPPPDSPPESSGYAGSAVCKSCHPDITSTFFRNPHYKSVAAGKLPPEKAGCESCHGPAKAHVAARGGKLTIPRAFSLLKPEAVLDACLECHSNQISRANIRRSAHTMNGVACTSCHSVHRSPTQKFLLARKQTDLCYTCHASVRAQFNMPVKHRVNEGFMNCSDCHNPHGAFAPTWGSGVRPRLAQQVLGADQPCLRCHRDKAGPFTFEHAAVRVEGCERCHFPHGSINARLLRRPVVFTMCLECHNGAGTFGRHSTGVVLQTSSHNMADPRYQNCTVCHARIHGSNSDQYFLR
ncbi:MAG: DmsE family decaheme c-type cytochrome, partial [Acidobacteria bacterium]|nr:DmsE family decaheme c-type cytochrome [Acidobacteriota bacterium]